MIYNILATGDFTEFFEQFLFGTGAWLGFVVIVSIILLVASQVKYSGALFIPVSLYLAMLYLGEITNPLESNFSIAVIILLFGVIPLLFYMEYKRK